MPQGTCFTKYGTRYRIVRYRYLLFLLFFYLGEPYSVLYPEVRKKELVSYL